MMVSLRGKGIEFNVERHGALHTISDDEVVAFSNTLNNIMAEHERWKDNKIDASDK